MTSLRHSGYQFVCLQTYYFIALCLITIGVSFVATLTIEGPFVNLEKLIVKSKFRAYMM